MDNTEMIRELTEVSERTKANSHRIDETEKEIDKLKEKTETIHTISTNIEKMCLSLSHTNEKLDENTKKLDENIQDVKSVKTEITELKNAPFKVDADRWKKAVGYIAATVGGGILMFLLSQIFPVVFGK